MFIAADMLVAHFVGDYMLQSDSIANNKTSSSVWALIYSIIYSIPFLLLTTSLFALLFIIVTHFIIDRYKIVRYLIFAWNRLWGSTNDWEEC